MAVVASLNAGDDYIKGGIYFWPRVFTLMNYSVVFKDKEIFRAC